MKSLVHLSLPCQPAKSYLPFTITLLSDWDLRVHPFEPGPPFEAVQPDAAWCGLPKCHASCSPLIKDWPSWVLTRVLHVMSYSTHTGTGGRFYNFQGHVFKKKPPVETLQRKWLRPPKSLVFSEEWPCGALLLFSMLVILLSGQRQSWLITKPLGTESRVYLSVRKPSSTHWFRSMFNSSM